MTPFRVLRTSTSPFLRRFVHQFRHPNLSTLAILEHKNKTFLPASLSAVTAATKLGSGPVTALLTGKDAKELSSAAAKLNGVSKILLVPNDAYDHFLPENFAKLIAEAAKIGEFTHVVAAHSQFGKNTIPRVGALLDAQPIADIIEIQSEDTFVRQIYAGISPLKHSDVGNALATVKSSDKIKLITVRGTAYPIAEEGSDEATVEEFNSDPSAPSPTTWEGEDLATSSRPDLSTASRVVSGGRGLKDKPTFDSLIPPLADALGAAIGASRAAVDAGYVENAAQVGQTGKIVAPELYLAVGISGAIQHLAGMKDSKVIAAINKDGDAPIFQVADVGLVGDLFKAVPELTEKLSASLCAEFRCLNSSVRPPRARTLCPLYFSRAHSVQGLAKVIWAKMMRGLLEMLETVRQTCPYDPKTPSEPGSAWDGEPDPVAKDSSPPPDCSPKRIPDNEARSFERLRQDTRELQRLGINGLFASRREELAEHNAREFPDNPAPVEFSKEQAQPPLRKPPPHRALLLEEIRQVARDDALDLHLLVEPNPIPYLEDLRLHEPASYASLLKAKAREEIFSGEPRNPATQQEPPPRPVINREGWLTAEEILTEIRKQLPPRPPSDSNSEPSDDWPWDSPPSTPSRTMEEDGKTPSTRRILPRAPLSVSDAPPLTPSKAVDEQRETPPSLWTPLATLVSRSFNPVIPPGFRPDWIKQEPEPPQAPPVPERLAKSSKENKYVPHDVAVDPVLHAALNQEIKDAYKKKQERMGISQLSENKAATAPEEGSTTSDVVTPEPPETARNYMSESQKESALVSLANKLGQLDMDVSDFQVKNLELKKGIDALNGKTSVLENGVTSLNSRTHGFANEITNLDLRTNALENGFGSLAAETKNSDTSGGDSRTKALENGITSLNSRTASFENSISALNSKTASLETGFLTLDSRTAGLDVPELKKKVHDFDLMAAAMIKHAEQGVVTSAAMTDRMGRLDGRLGDVEDKVHGLQEFNERTPELKKLLSEGKQIGDHLQSLNDGVHGAKVGIANLNEGFTRVANVLQNHAHHINRVDNELIEHKNTEEHHHNDLVERVDGLKNGLTLFGVGAGMISAAGFGLWAWSRASKWLKRSKEKKELEATARGNAGEGGGLKRRSHAREWNQFEF